MPPQARHHRRSRTARRAAERARARVDRRQDRVRQPAERGAPAGHRGVGVRQPEVGAADGGRRRGVRRHHARAGHPLHRARAEPRGPRTRDRGRRHRDRRSSPRPPKPSAARTSTRASTSRWRPTGRSATARSRAGLRVRGYLSTAFGCPFEGAVDAGAGRRASPRGSRSSACSRWRSATRSASRIRARCRACSRRCSRACRSIASRCTSTTRAARRSPTCWRRCRSAIATFDASAGGLGGCPYAPGAAGNLATDDLIYMLDGLGIETGVSLAAVSEASAFIASRLDHRLPSRYAQAAAARGS